MEYLLRQAMVPKLLGFLLTGGIAAYLLLVEGVLWFWIGAFAILMLILFLLSLIPGKDPNNGWGDW